MRIAVSSCPVPRLVPYNKLMPFTKSIDIGQLHSVRETLCHGLDEEEKVDGIFRDQCSHQDFALVSPRAPFSEKRAL